MTEKEMLKLEEDNYTTMHLHLVGIFWRAYQRSALGFCREIRPYKMNVRRNKRHRTVVSFLGFPDSALQDILAGKEYCQVDDTHITLAMPHLSNEEAADLLPEFGDHKGLSPTLTPPFETNLKEQILTFKVHCSTPLECMSFIVKLQTQLNYSGIV